MFKDTSIRGSITFVITAFAQVDGEAECGQRQ